MTICLTPGYRANIIINDSRHNCLYEEKFTSREEVEEFIVKYRQSKKPPSMLFCSVVPLRTNNFKIFANDFFFPTFNNFVVKKTHVFTIKIFIYIRILESIFAILSDLITFPVRVITSPFRAYHNSKHAEDPPIAMLIKTNLKHSEKAIEEGVVTLKCFEVDTKIGNTSAPVQNGDVMDNASQLKKYTSIQVVFKAVPGIRRTLPYQRNENSTFIKLNNQEWVRENYSSSRL